MIKYLSSRFIFDFFVLKPRLELESEVELL